MKSYKIHTILWSLKKNDETTVTKFLNVKKNLKITHIKVHNKTLIFIRLQF